MARLWTAGAELNDLAGEAALLGGTWSPGSSLAISTANPRSGSKHWRTTATGLSAISGLTGAVGTTYYLRHGVYLSGLPGSVQTLMGMGDSSRRVEIALNADGTLILYGTIIATQIGSPSIAVSAGSYFVIELAYRVGVGSIDYAEARLNFSSFASASNLNLTDTAPSSITLFGGVTGLTIDYDDVAYNDSSGSQQNSWPGNGKVVLSVPISDNAIGTGWTLGTGTATGGNAFAAEDNEPPQGVADLTAGSDTKQIRNATSNANSNVDLNMQSYTTLGITADDVVTVVDPIVSTGAPVTTSAKQGTVGVVSNPTIANVALGAGGTSGAFWSGVAAGTYPTGWKWSHGTVTYNPVITVGTSPVMRLTQVTSSTRIAMADFMGMYIEYIPAMPRRERRNPNQALQWQDF